MSITPLVVGEVTNLLPYKLEIPYESKGTAGPVILRTTIYQYHNIALAIGKSNFHFYLPCFQLLVGKDVSNISISISP